MPMAPRLHPLVDRGDSLPDADAHGGETDAEVLVEQVVDQGRRDASAAGAERPMYMNGVRRARILGRTDSETRTMRSALPRYRDHV